MSSKVKNPQIGLYRFLLSFIDAIWAILRLVIGGFGALFGKGSIKEKLAAHFGKASTQQLVFSVLRVFKPKISLKKKLVNSYDNTGTVIITRRKDVERVLTRDVDFEVVYGTRMRKLTHGENFFLGMQPGRDYDLNTSNMRLAARREDVERIVIPRANKLAAEIVKASQGRIDLPADLSLEIPWDMTDTYFGVGGPNAITMKNWATTLFGYLFTDLKADEAYGVEAMEDALALRGYLDRAIANRKAKPTQADDMLNRCLALQKAGQVGMSDLDIRNNLLGLLIGAIPTISKASCLAIDELLRRPKQLAGAQAAARADDDTLMAQYIWEALRFNPHNPVIYRRATRDTLIAGDTLRSLKVRKGQMVFAANFSAMFDRKYIPHPNSFRTNRPWETYMHWGYGLHNCFGAAINRAIIPAILKPVLLQSNLRRAEGDHGQIDSGGTPFPKHFILEFDPA